MYMIMYVLDNPDLLDPLLESWEAAGIHGATILESTGIQRLQRKHVPMRYLFQSTGAIEAGHLTLFVIVDGEQMVQDCLHATEQIVVNLDDPNTGIFAAWPLTVVRGMSSHPREE